MEAGSEDKAAAVQAYYDILQPVYWQYLMPRECYQILWLQGSVNLANAFALEGSDQI